MYLLGALQARHKHKAFWPASFNGSSFEDLARAREIPDHEVTKGCEKIHIRTHIDRSAFEIHTHTRPDRRLEK